MNPFLKRHGGNKHGLRAERRFARRMSVRRVPGSGSIPGFKGDFVSDKFLIESKSTNKGSLGVKREWLEKIEREALEKNRIPALTISFVMESGVAHKGGEWVAIPLWAFESIME